MKLSKLLCVGVLLAPAVNASEMSCGGQITMVMADHPSSNLGVAFKTTMSGPKWMCTKSKEAGSVVLTAFTTEKSTYVAIDNANAAICPDLPHYREIGYVIVYAQ